MKYNFFTVKYLLASSMSVVLTVKVEGLIKPPLAQMVSTKACYKLGLNDIPHYQFTPTGHTTSGCGKEQGAH